MELSRAERTRLGAFLVIASLLVVGTIASLVIREVLSKDVAYEVAFRESVDGLNGGAKVKLQGVEVGRVTSLHVDPADLGSVVVTFEVKRGTPMKPGMRANLVGGLSVTGMKSVELMGGDALAEDLPPGTRIQAGTSQLRQLSGQAEAIVLKTEQVMNNLLAITGDENQANVASLIRSLSRLAEDIDTVVHANRGRLMTIPADLQSSLAQLDTTVRTARRVAEELRAARIPEAAKATVLKYVEVADAAKHKVEAARVQESLKAIEDAARAMETASKRMDVTIYRTQEDLQASMRNLRETMENMSDFSRQIKENPSLLLRGEDKAARVR